MHKYRTDISVKFIRDTLDYNPETGVLSWKERKDRKVNWNHRWTGKTAGHVHEVTGHIIIQIKGRSAYGAHRLAWVHYYGEWPKDQIDHIDGNRQNNRISNLRCATNSENNRNRGPQSNNLSGYKGVSWHEGTKKWYARINADGVVHRLGLYATPEEASKAYTKAARQLHQEFARTENFAKRYDRSPK